MRSLIMKLTVFLIYIINVQSECNVCQYTNRVACSKENEYSLCVNGTATDDYITCPEDHMCTSDPYICVPKATPSCIRDTYLCGVCSENKLYACINETTIAFCYGEHRPIEGSDVSYCPNGTVCDIYSKKGFCTESYLTKPSCITTTEETTTTINPTTDITTESIITSTSPTTDTTEEVSTTEEPSTTPPITTPKPLDPNFACEQVGATGSYFVGDPTCRTYVLCYQIGDTLLGRLMTCPENQYFPPGAQFCTLSKPDVCV